MPPPLRRPLTGEAPVEPRAGAPAAARSDAGGEATGSVDPVAGDLRFAAGLTLAFGLLVAFGLASHEMWRDELQAWMLARDSATVGALLHNMRHEGHPPGWHLLLFGLARLTRDPVAMQVLHGLIATATAFVVARWAPFRRLDRVLLVFGYFLAYEYAVVSRSYALGALMLFAACALLAARRRSRRALVTPFVAVLAVLANTTLYGLLSAAALAGAVVFERLVRPAPRRAARRRIRTLLLAGVVVAATTAAVIAGARRIADAPQVPLRGADRSIAGVAHGVARVSSVVLRAYLPLPDPRVPAAWSQPAVRDVDGGRWRPLAIGLAAFLLAAAALAVAPAPLALAFLVAGTALHLAVSYFVLFGTARHHGNTFLVLVAALWLARADGVARWRLPSVVARVRARAARAGPPALSALLALHLPATASMYALDARRPFSASRAVADHLRPLGDVPIAVVPGPPGSTLAAWLDRPVHFVQDGLVGTFVDWGRQSGDRYPSDAALERVCALADSAGLVAFVTVRPLDRPPPCVAAIPPALEFDAILATESFHVYRVERPPEPAATARPR